MSEIVWVALERKAVAEDGPVAESDHLALGGPRNIRPDSRMHLLEKKPSLGGLASP